MSLAKFCSAWRAILDHQHVECRGYPILPTAFPEDGDLYFEGYELSKEGKIVIVGKNLMPGCFYRDLALRDSVEHPKLEFGKPPCKGMPIDMRTAALTANAVGRPELRRRRRSAALP